MRLRLRLPPLPHARGGDSGGRWTLCLLLPLCLPLPAPAYPPGPRPPTRPPACLPVCLSLQDHTQRPSAKEALRHPWLSPAFHAAKQRPISSTVVQRIQRFAQNNALRRTILELIAQVEQE